LYITLSLGSAIYYRDDIRLLAASAFTEQPPPSYSSSVRSQYHAGYDQLFPRIEWEKNWDLREPVSLVDQDAYLKATDEEKKEMLKKLKPTATRHIFLIRHGNFLSL
jgi:hypothetical protein